MSAPNSYSTSVLMSFSTFLERSAAADSDKQAATRLLQSMLEWKTDYGVWHVSEIEAFLSEKAAANPDTQNQNATQLLKQFIQHFPPYQISVYLQQYLLALKEDGCSASTIRNYRSDINQFWQFAKVNSPEHLFTKPVITKFVRYEKQKGLQNSSIRRKLASIAQFGLWAHRMGLLAGVSWLKNPNLLEETEADLSKTGATAVIIPVTTKPVISSVPADSKPTQPPIELPKDRKPTARKFQERRAQIKAQLDTLSERVKQQSRALIAPYLTLAAVILFFLGVGIFGYQQLIVNTPSPLAYPSVPTPPNRVLSFQGRLTDIAQNPLTTATDMQFELYDTGPGTGGTLLWDSGTCSITPDQDGIFTTGLGSDCGPAITEDVFTENVNVWLQVSVESETLTPRQPIRTVPYALNSETLQGYPISATGAATVNTILFMDGGGSVVLGEVNPEIRSISGTFSIQGQSLLLQTTANNGNIVLDANGTGGIYGLDYFSAPGATFSATYAGGIPLIARGGPSGTADIFQIQNNSGSALSVFDETGRLGIGTSNPTNVLHVMGGATSGITLDRSGGTAFTWQRNANNQMQLTAGGSPMVTYSDNGNVNFLFNVGINSTSPGANLDVVGTLRASGNVTFSNYNTPGGIFYAQTGGLLGVSAAGNSGECLLSGGAGTPTFGSCAGAVADSILWQQVLGTAQLKNTTLDLLVGGTSTASADFAVLNINGTGPATATVSGNLIVMPKDGAGGRVGIGTTAPDYNLTIRRNGVGITNYLQLMNQNNTAGDGSGIAFNHGGATSAIHASITGVRESNGYESLRFNAGTGSAHDTEIMRIGGLTANVGIGTTTPQDRLSVAVSTNGPVAQFRSTGSGDTHMLRLSVNTDVAGGALDNYVTFNSVGDNLGGFTFGSSTNEYLRIQTSTGNVGIGTTNPSQRLHVVGNSTFVPTGTVGIIIDALGTDPRVFSNGTIVYQANNASLQHRFTNQTGVSLTGTLMQIDTGGTALNNVNLLNVINGGNNVFTVRAVTGGGNIGIGTAAPVAPLHINRGFGSNAAAIINQLNAGDILAASASGTTRLRLSNAGGLYLSALNTAGGVVYTDGDGQLLTSAAGTTGDCLLSGGAGTPTFGSCAGAVADSILWQQVDGTAQLKNTTLDLLVGGTSTASAKFAVTGINSGVPTATIAGSTAGAALSLNGEGNISTTLNRVLNLQPNGGGVAIGNTVDTTAQGELLRFRIGSSGSASGYMSFQRAATNTSYQIGFNGGNLAFGLLKQVGDSAETIGITSPNTVNSDKTISFGSANGVVDAYTRFFASDASETIPVLLANNNTSLTGNPALAFASVNTVGTQFTHAKISALKDQSWGSGSTPFGALAFYTTNGSATLNEVGRFSSSGNFGVGTTNPSVQLDVQGNIRANKSNTNSGGIYLRDGTTHGILYNNPDIFYMIGQATGDHRFYTNSTERLRVTNLGNIGIGTTTPIGKFVVSGAPGQGGNALAIFNQTNSDDILAASASGTTRLRLSNAGGLYLSALNTAGGIVYTDADGQLLTSAAGISGECLLSGGTGAPTFGSCAGAVADSILWQQVDGTAQLKNTTLDLIVGGTSTASAKFAVLNINANTPTASISANSGNIATYLTGDGTLATTNRQSLTIGNSSTYNTTGNVLINPNGTGNVGIGTTAPAAKLNIAIPDAETTIGLMIHDLGITGGSFMMRDATNNAATFEPNFRGTSAGSTSRSFIIQGDSTAADSGTTPLTVFRSTVSNGAVATRPLFQWQNNSTAHMTMDASGNLGIGTTNPGAKLDIAGTLRASGAVTFSNYTTDGGIFYANGTGGLLAQTTTGSAGECLVSNGGGAPTWASCSAAGGQLWRLANGAISPINDTLDLLIGSSATDSAKFAFINVNGPGVPTASISGNITLNSAGQIQTTNNQSLTIGGDSTGNIRINPLNGTGFVGINNSNPRASLDISGSASLSGTLAFRGSTDPKIEILNDEAFGIRTSPGGNAGLTERFTILNNGNVGIGTTSPTAKLQINTGDDSTVGQVIRANSGTQTANLQEWQSSGGTTLSQVNPNGTFKINDFTASIANTYGYDVTINPSSTAGVRGVSSFIDFDAGSDNTQSLGSEPISVYAYSRLRSGRNSTNLTSVFGQMEVRSGSTISNAYIFRGRLSGTSLDAGNITNLYGYYLDFNSNPVAAVTNAYGLYLNNINQATNNFAIVTNAGNIVFNEGGDGNTDFRVEGDTDANLLFVDASADRIGIGTSVPGAKLHISGNNINSFNTGALFTNTTGAESWYAGVGQPGFENVSFVIRDITNGATRFVIRGSNDGGVGIGGITTPGSRLVVRGANNLSSASALNITDSSDVSLLFVRNNGSIGIGTTVPFGKLDVRGLNGTTSVASFSGQTAFAAALVDNNGVGDIFTASKSGATKFTVLNNGNVRINNLNTAGAVIYTDSTGLLGSSAQGNVGECLLSGGSGTPTWGSCSASSGNLWRLASGAISPVNDTVDLLIGSNATTSAKFAFINVNGPGTPTATIAGSVAGNALSITGDGTIATTLNRSLILNPSGGNVGIGTSSPSVKLNVIGDATFENTSGTTNTTVTIKPFGVGTNGVLSIYGTDGAGTQFEAGRIRSGIPISGIRGLVIDTTNTSTGPAMGFVTTNSINGHIVFSPRGSEAVRIYSNGDVGIGSTSPTAKLDIAGNASMSGTLTFRGTTDPRINILNAENFGIWTSPGGDAGLTEKFTMLNNGNVGIGTTNPGTKLDVFNTSAGDNEALAYFRGSTTTNAAGLYVRNFAVGSDDDRVGLYWQHESVANMRMWMGDNQYLYSSSNTPTSSTNGRRFIQEDVVGNVGIGTTSPGAMLDIAGNASSSGNLAFRGATPKIDIFNGANLGFRTSPGGPTGVSEKMTLTSSGNLGIGATVPTYRFQISGASAGTVFAGVNSSAVAAGDVFYYGVGSNAVTGAVNGINLTANASTGFTNVLRNANSADGTSNTTLELITTGASAGDPFMIYTISGVQNWVTGIDNSDSDKFKIGRAGNLNSNIVMTFDTNSNVGIGSTTPGALLDIAGTLRASGAVTFSNYTTDGGIFYANGTGGLLAQTTAGSAGECLVSSGGGAPTWASCSAAGGQLWRLASGAISPVNDTVDLLIGSNATSSAKFAFINVNGPGTPTATIAGSVAGNALSITGDGTIATTLNRSLILNPSGGNVGIGTTSPFSNLQISSTDTYLTLTDSDAASGSRNIYLRSSSGRLAIGAKNDAGTNVNEAVSVLATGNVGIGSTAPIGKFVVSGAPAQGGNALAIFNQTDSTGDILAASASGTNRMVLTNGGNLGIGTTSPTVRLHAYHATGDQLARFESGDSIAKIEIADPTANAFAVVDSGFLSLGSGAVLGTSNLNIDILGGDAGEVGIGTTDPLKLLHVGAGADTPTITTGGAYITNAGATALVVRNSTADVEGFLYAGAGTSNDEVLFGAATNHAVRFRTNNVTRMTLDTGGRLGLGTTAAAATFDVRGQSGTQPVASFSGTTAIAAGIFDNNGVGDILTASKSGATKFTVLNDGNVRIDNLNTAGGIVYTDATGLLATSVAGSVGQCLVSGGSGAPTWTSCSGASGNFWRINLGALSPVNDTLDLLIGSDSTASAKFAFMNVNNGIPSASISGTGNNRTFLTGDGNLATTNSQTLTIGGSSTGNIIVSPLNGTGTLALNGTQTISSDLIVGGTTLAASMFSIDESTGAFAINSDNSVATPTITFDSGNGNDGSLAFNNNDAFVFSNANVGIGATNPSSLLSVGTGSLFQVNSSGNIVQIGGVAHVIRDLSGALFIDSSGTAAIDIGTGASAKTITLGNSTGATLLNLNSGTGGTILRTAGVERMRITSNGNVGIGTTAPIGKFVVSGAPGAGGNALAIFNQTNSDDIFTASASGTTRMTLANNGTLTLTAYTTNGGLLYTNGSGVVAQTAAGTAEQCLAGGTTPTWTTCSTIGSHWRIVDGAISPDNDTLDLLVGSSATSSAKFAFINVDSGTPTASISANSGNNNTYLTGDGTLATTNRQTLTIGNSSTYNTTGNILLHPNGTGRVGIGSTAPEYPLDVLSSTADGAGRFTLTTTSGINQAVIGRSTGSGATVNTGGSFTASGATQNFGLSVNLTGGTGTNVGGSFGASGASTNRGITISVAAGANNHAIYSSNTAQSYLEGSLGIGTSSPLAKLVALQSATQDPDTAPNQIITQDGANWRNFTLGDGGVATYSATAFDSAQRFDGVSTYTDNTTEARTNQGTTFTLLTAENPSNDIFYVGLDHPFSTIYMDIAVPGSGVTLVREYWNGSAWTAIPSAVDSTANLSQDGTITFAAPSDWANTIVNGVTKRWVRLSSSTPVTTAPTAHTITPTTGQRFSIFAMAGDSNPTLQISDQGNVGIGTLTPISKLHVDGQTIGKALALLNETGNQDILTASASGTTRLRITNAGQLLAGDGTNSAPTFAFLDDTDTGLYSSGDNELSLSIGGTQSFIFSSSAFRGVLGSAGTPGISFTGDTNTGIFGDGSDVLGFSTNGAERMRINNIGRVGIGTTTLVGGVNISMNAGGNAALIVVDTAGSNDIIVASSSATTRFRVDSAGYVHAQRFSDIADGNFFLDPAATGNSLVIAGDIELGGANGSNDIHSTGNANIDINAGSGTVMIGGGTGKFDAGTIDPPYWIEGKGYATYAPSMVGLNEEIAQVVTLQPTGTSGLYKYVIDFANLNKNTQTDLWLFSRITAIDPDMGNLAVLVSAGGDNRVGYIKDAAKQQLIIYGDKATEVTFRLTAPRFNAGEFGTIRKNQDGRGFRPAAKSYAVTAGGTSDQDLVTALNQSQTWNLSTIGTLTIDGQEAGAVTVRKADGSVVTKAEALGNAVIGQLRSGFIQTGKLIADQVNTSRLFVSQRVESPEVATNLISPVSGDELTLKANQLKVKNNQNQTVAQIDKQGNANFAGNVTSKGLLSDLVQTQQLNAASISAETINAASISATQADITSARLQTIEARMAELQEIRANTADIVNATVSGTLYASDIYAFEDKVASALQAPSLLSQLMGQIPQATSSASLDALYQVVDVDPAIASGSGSLNRSLADLNLGTEDVVLGASATFINNYFEVNGTGYIADSLGIGNSLLVGTGTRLSDGELEYISPTDPTTSVLKLQPSGVGSIDLLAGAMRITQDGNVTINGNLHVAGEVKANTLLTNLLQPADFGNPFQVQVAGVSTESGEVKKSRFEIINELGTPVATISAEGKADFAGGIGVGAQDLGTEQNPETDKTSGKATIAANTFDVTIKTNKVTPDSLVYVTPVGSTGNQVLYVKSQTPDNPETPENEGQIVVGFDAITLQNVQFNWWIVN